MVDKEPTESRTSRRRLLEVLGSGAVTTAYVDTGIASAAPGRGNGSGDDHRGGVGPCTCEDDCPADTFCGKIEGYPEAGATYTFSGDDDEYSVTIEEVSTKESDDEVTCFEFSSSDEIERVCIKGGPDIASYDDGELDGKLCAPENPGGRQAAISNVSFCGTGAECFQIDLVGGEPIEKFDPDDGGTYSAQERLIESFFGCADEAYSRPEGEERTVSLERDAYTAGTKECTFSWDSFSFDGRVATVTLGLVEVENGDRCEGTLVGYLLPNGVEDEPGDLEEQELRTSETVSLKEGESTTLRIDLTPRLKWRFETGGSVRSSPTIVDGTVYAGSTDDNVYALDAETGEERWRFETGDHVHTSPNVVGGTVYVGSRDNNVYALDAETGEERWRFETGSLVESSPTVFDGTVYVGSQDTNVYALDAETGDERWRFETGDTVQSSPTVVGGTVYIGSFDSTLYALDADDGTRQWEFETEASVVSSPTVADGTVYVGDTIRGANVYAIDAETGEERWRFDTEAGVFSSPTVADGTVYVGDASGGGNVYALDAETGEERWRFDAGRSVHTSSPTVADGTVYIGSFTGNGYAIDAETGEKQWRFAVLRSVASSPTVVDGVVYVCSRDNNVYALDADTDGDSEDSRVRLGTLGHHGVWANQ